MKAPIEAEPLTIIVTDLIDQGLINPPTTVFGTHSGKPIEALLMPNGTFVHRGNIYSSPSVAAGRAITAEVGSRPSVAVIFLSTAGNFGTWYVPMEGHVVSRISGSSYSSVKGV